MTSSRVRNWDVLLVLWARELIGQPFEWGRTDCGTLVRGALEVMYGDDVLADVVGSSAWKSTRGAAQTLKRAGAVGDALRGIGGRVVHSTFLQAADVVEGVSGDLDGLPQLGVCIGPKVLHVDRETGVATSRVAALDRDAVVWRLP